MNTNTSPEMAIHTNIMIVGAGLSGIGAAVHLQKSCPDRDYMLILSEDGATSLINQNLKVRATQTQ